jgi:signal transduction histidine kinase
MRLHDFIDEHREQILVEWESFARSCAPSSDVMDVDALRDHADQMLSVIAADLRTYQGAHAQSEKSKGHAPDPAAVDLTAAEEHGAGRAGSGFTVEQMVAEFRALRASVIRLWTREQGTLQSVDIEDLTRFNEAIDQSLAESVSEFNENIETAKEMFLAILGHDLRTPLGAIYTSARFMLASDERGEESHRTLAEVIAKSALRTTRMVGDLLDFTRSRLGGGIPILRAETNLETVVRDVVEEIRAANPDREVRVETHAVCRGEWDVDRISQALANLIGNAVEHGAPGTAVLIEIDEAEDVVIAIRNRGATIPPDRLDGIFNPMKVRGAPRQASAHGPSGNLGLGLFIAERIVHAHGGWIGVASSEECGTTFTVHLPHGATP